MMKIKFLLLPLCLVALSCIGLGRTKVKTVEAESKPLQVYGYEIKATYPHATDSYTQGLIYHDGKLLEGTGLEGQSRIMEVEIESGQTREISKLSAVHFGEGITILGDTLYQLTWVTNRLFLYDVASGKKLGEKVYSGEGWGITNDGEKLYVSDGSSVISVRDPQSYKVEKKILVTIDGEPLEYLNELEWINGKIWANVYTQNQVVIIDPASGDVEGVIDFRGLLKAEDITETTDVLNGIAYDADNNRVFVTGKNWNKLFEVEIIKR